MKLIIYKKNNFSFVLVRFIYDGASIFDVTIKLIFLLIGIIVVLKYLNISLTERGFSNRERTVTTLLSVTIIQGSLLDFAVAW